MRCACSAHYNFNIEVNQFKEHLLDASSETYCIAHRHHCVRTAVHLISLRLLAVGHVHRHECWLLWLINGTQGA